jgi:hypothetical protein
MSVLYNVAQMQNKYQLDCLEEMIIHANNDLYIATEDIKKLERKLQRARAVKEDKMINIERLQKKLQRANKFKEIVSRRSVDWLNTKERIYKKILST